MSESYLFYGVVLPERAQLSLDWELSVSHLTSGLPLKIKVSIILNQVAVWVEADQEWGIYDLRNVIKTVLQNQLSMVGYLKGFAYDVEVTRVLKADKKIDYVFGVGIPYLVERGKSIDLNDGLSILQNKTHGDNGIFINRCLNDLISAMKNADDTGFYCYRAIESLRHHCTKNNGLSDKKGEQWDKFRELTNCSEDDIFKIKNAADPLRHGEVTSVTSSDREGLFKLTWDIVEKYLENI